MSAWLENHLEERLALMKGDEQAPPAANLPQVSDFVCPDNGMQWCDKVLGIVPVRWRDQMKRSLKECAPIKTLKEGFLDMESFVCETATVSLARAASSTFSVGQRKKRWLVLMPHELRWRLNQEESQQCSDSLAGRYCQVHNALGRRRAVCL